MSRSVPEWIGKTDDTPVPPRVRRPVGAPVTVDYLLSQSIPEPNSGCWLWLGACHARGYGVIRIDRRTKRAHRVMYEIAKGVCLTSDVDVCHRCDVRCCVNPDHLFVGSRAENMRDCSNKGRIVLPILSGDRCPNSRLTSEQVLAIRDDKQQSNRALARKYGVDKGTIACIRDGRTWSDMAKGTARETEEWAGVSPRAAIPNRVKLRIFERHEGKCAACTRQLRPGHWDIDHIVALINGGRHAESNLQPLCKSPCHSDKTRGDVTEKSTSYKRRAKHYGVRKAKQPIAGWRRFDGTPVRNPKLERRRK